MTGIHNGLATVPYLSRGVYQRKKLNGSEGSLDSARTERTCKRLMDARLGDLSGSTGALGSAAAPQSKSQPVRELRRAGCFKKCGECGGIEQERLRRRQ